MKKVFKVAGMFISIALTSFLKGITEPIEFAFMFLAPGLYVIHAILTGSIYKPKTNIFIAYMLFMLY